MTSFFINSDFATTGVESSVYELVTSDRLIVGPDAVLSTTGLGSAVILGASNLRISVAGDLFSAEDRGIFIGGDSNVAILQGGSITANGDGMRIGGSGSQVTNDGAINSEFTAIRFDGSNNQVANSGLISGGFGIVSAGFTQVTNTGEIRSIGVLDSGGGNTGATLLIDGGAVILNSGSILSFGSAIVTSGDAVLGSVTLTNTGLIAARPTSSAINLNAGADLVRNSGSIVGSVSLSSGDDRYDGHAGVLLGSLNGEAGNDTLIGGAGTESIAGGNDSDSIIGGAGDDSLSGDNGNDTIMAGDGDDIVDGGLGIDVLDGGAGYDALSFANSTAAVNADLATGEALGGAAEGDIVLNFEELRGSSLDDTLAGSNGADRLVGNNGADILGGLAGNDRLDGSLGNDTLFGNAGGDLLRGGAGADSFRYTAITDSTALATGRDRIVDFSKAELDVINLFNIDANTTANGNQAFAFIGTAAFGSVAGQLRYATTAQVTYVLGDVNGDAVADFSIQLAGVILLSPIDFVL